MGAVVRVVSLPLSALFVVSGEVAVLAETLGVVNHVLVLTLPRHLCPSKSVIAVHTHAFRVVRLVGVGALVYFAFFEAGVDRVSNVALHFAFGARG